VRRESITDIYIYVCVCIMYASNSVELEKSTKYPISVTTRGSRESRFSTFRRTRTKNITAFTRWYVEQLSHIRRQIQKRPFSPGSISRGTFFGASAA